jgi:large subunit ribosomal protein L13
VKNMILVNADGLVLGRVASFCAKRAMKGEDIVVVNAEKAIVTGSKRDLLQRFHQRFGLSVKGNPRKGPKASRMPDLILRSSVKGMLPTKRRSGREALGRVKVFIGVPREFEGKRFEELHEAKGRGVKNFMLLGELSGLLGAKW